MHHSGAAWDAFGGAPDPIVNVYVGSETNRVAVFNGPDDTFRITFTNARVGGLRASDLLSYLSFAVFDEDVSDYEFIGRCFSRPLDSSVWAGGTQIFNCPREPATGQSGFTLRWRLERD